MKKALFIISLFFISQSFAQMTIQYGGSIGFDANYRSLTNNNDLWMINDAIIDSRNDVEKFCARPSLGFDFKINLSEKMGLRTGVLYDVKGYMLKGDFTLGTTLETIKFVSRAYDHFLAVPLYFTYTFPMGSAGLELTGGLLNNFYLQTNEKGKTTYENGDKIKTSSSHSNHSRVMEQLVLGSNYIFASSSNMEMSLGLDFKYAFTSIAGATNIREYYYSIGLNFGILFGGKG